jgi:8-oxo-dGTP diphosphatase
MHFTTSSRRRRKAKKAPVRTSAKRRVVSAGGVVLRSNKGVLETLLIAIKEGRMWSLPKGQVEQGERYPQTAVREVREETGIEARVLAPLGSIRYHFTVKDDATPVTVTKEVHHFLMKYVSGQPRPQKEEVDDAAWFPVTEALTRLSHQNERDVLLKALARWEMGAKVSPTH